MMSDIGLKKLKLPKIDMQAIPTTASFELYTQLT